MRDANPTPPLASHAASNEPAAAAPDHAAAADGSENPRELLGALIAQIKQGICPDCQTCNWEDTVKSALTITCKTCGQAWSLEINGLAWDG